VLVEGTGFPPGQVSLTWQLFNLRTGLGKADATADAAGTFRTRLLIFNKDQTGSAQRRGSRPGRSDRHQRPDSRRARVRPAGTGVRERRHRQAFAARPSLTALVNARLRRTGHGCGAVVCAGDACGSGGARVQGQCPAAGAGIRRAGHVPRPRLARRPCSVRIEGERARRRPASAARPVADGICRPHNARQRRTRVRVRRCRVCRRRLRVRWCGGSGWTSSGPGRGRRPGRARRCGLDVPPPVLGTGGGVRGVTAGGAGRGCRRAGHAPRPRGSGGGRPACGSR
jgi:hypothetical protein